MFLTLVPIFVPDAVPAFFGVREVGTLGASGYVPPKTLWDWFGLVAIPFAIVVVGYVLNRADRNHEQRLQEQRLRETRKIEAQRIAESRGVEERRIEEARELESQRIAENRKIEEERLKESRGLEENRAQDAIVKDYLDQMTELLLTRGLRASLEGDEVRSVARARTLTALRGIDGVRKATIVQFLYEARLIGYVDGEETAAAVVHLHKADLCGTNLDGFNLSGVNLSGAILFGARLGGARLGGAHLAEANLIMAKLPGANLGAANLMGANLMGADLGAANLMGANLSDAVLGGAMLDQTDLERANGLTPAQLRRARTLHSAELPDYIDPADLGDKWSPPKTTSTPEPKP